MSYNYWTKSRCHCLSFFINMHMYMIEYKDAFPLSSYGPGRAYRKEIGEASTYSIILSILI